MPPGYLLSLKISLGKGRWESVFLDNFGRDEGLKKTVSVGQDVLVRVFE